MPQVMVHIPDRNVRVLRVLSLGAGVQSTTLALMAAHGEIGPMPDCAIFADTQHESHATYEHLRWLTSPNVLPFPVFTVSAGDLWKSATAVRTKTDGLGTYLKTGLPVFTLNGTTKGRGGRQCTSDFKIEPIQKKLRDILDRKRITRTSGVCIEMLIGISVDEAMRMKPSKLHWIKNEWPLVDKNMDREACVEWCIKHDYPIPPSSACKFCPHHDDNYWLDMTPDEFAEVCIQEIELQTAYANASGFDSVPFFHRSCVPLSEVKFVRRPSKRSQRPLPFGAECEGMCGV